MTLDNHDPKILVALDFETRQLAEHFVDTVTPDLCRLKIGKELFAVAGRDFVETCIAKGFDVFLDLKYHDIPNTVAKACQAASEMGVWMINVHAMGGRRMMTAAKEAIIKAQHQPILIGVTVLTSMEQIDLSEIGMQGTPEENVLRLAKLAQQSGLDGVVCSAHEVAQLRTQVGQDFCLVTPGIRPLSAAKDDQRRIMTPEQAIKTGSSYLVIGRPITQSIDPVKTLGEINLSIQKLNSLS